MQKILFLIAILAATGLSHADDIVASPVQNIQKEPTDFLSGADQEAMAGIRSAAILHIGTPHLGSKFCIVGTEFEQMYAIQQALAREAGESPNGRGPNTPTEAEVFAFLAHNFPCQASAYLPPAANDETGRFVACIAGYAAAKYGKARLSQEQAAKLAPKVIEGFKQLCPLPSMVNERLFDQPSQGYNWVDRITRVVLVTISHGQRMLPGKRPFGDELLID